MIDRPCPASTHERLMVMAATDLANTMKTTSKNGDNDRLYIHALKMWFRNYYVAYICVCIVCVKINNDELFYNAFPFENS